MARTGGLAAPLIRVAAEVWGVAGQQARLAGQAALP